MKKIQSRKKISVLLSLTVVLLCTGLVWARSTDTKFENFEGTSHGDCHGSTTLSTSGSITILSSSGITVNTDEIFTISLQVLTFTEALAHDGTPDISLGFPSGDINENRGNPNGRDDNRFFIFNTTVYHGVQLDGSGNSGLYYFQITAPSSTGSYILTADGIEGTRSTNAGQSDIIDFVTQSITITVQTPPNNPPRVENVTESANSLELGDSETFTVDVRDAETSVSSVLIELEGTNYTMVLDTGNTYTYDWTPSTTGLKTYTIYGSDDSGKWNSTSGSITVVDTTVPNLFNIVENVDPLELGGTETFSVNITDISSLSGVWITIDSQSFNLTLSGGEIWTNSSWTPSTTGVFPYTIYAVDAQGNLNTTAGSISVVDTTVPNLFNVAESADPLELGTIETFSVNLTDFSSISGVWMTVDGQSFNLTQSGAEVWTNSSWFPLTTGIFPYTIYAIDAFNNVNTTGGSITVIDNGIPNLFNVVESADPLELGGTETFSVNITDLSSLSGVWITVDGQTFNLTQSGSEIWTNSSWTPSTTGTFPYIIYAVDASGNVNTMAGSISVVDTTDPNLFNIVESADPLELGGTETFSVNITDLSSLPGVWITIDSQSFNLTLSGGEIWTNSSWTPSTTGVFPYTIYAVDASGNLNTTAGSISVVDTTAPNLFNIVESANPLELGGTETFSVNITDLSSLSGIWITVDGQTFNLTQSGAEVWTNSSWFPSTPETYPYAIYAVDIFGNVNTIMGSIIVVDTTIPNLFNVVESADPLELGAIETFSVNITDLSSLSGVWITIDSQTFNLTQSGTEVWTNSSWYPSTMGNFSYTIYAIDASGNLNTTSGSISVVDTTVPNLYNVVESTDPLELGGSESFSVNITDLSSLSGVWITIDSQSFNLTLSGGEIWTYSSWFPSTTGSFPYTIYAVDASGNINTTTGSISVVDTLAPIWNNLIESADPLPLGQNETILIDTFDIGGSGILEVLIEYEGFNHSMTFIGGNTWRYSLWKPGSVGNYQYEIFTRDNSDNWNSTTGDITVIASSGPSLENILIEFDPLELGDTVLIQIDVNDSDGVHYVQIEFNGTRYNMTYVTGNTYEYSNWIPTAIGNQGFTIYSNDTFGNINSFSSSYFVIDTTVPTYENLSENPSSLELGANSTISIDLSDLGGISNVLIEINNENKTMINLNSARWEYNWTPSQTGNLFYTIYIFDYSSNMNSTSGSITVVDTTVPNLFNVVESADPLELGSIETFSVNITDLSSLSGVWITIDGQTFNLTQSGTEIWTNSSWFPSTTGTYSYTIYAVDVSGNLNTTAGSITVVDTTVPNLFNVVESAEPLELGGTETFSANITDLSSLSGVWITIDGQTFNLTQSGAEVWIYSSWTPSTTGVFSYTIYAIDASGNLNITSGSITVVDTTVPNLFNVVESADPLELGSIETFSVNITDLSSLSGVWITIDGQTFNLTQSGAEIWTNSSWFPSTTGTYSYTIYAVDVSGNLNSTAGSITVEDTTVPNLFNVVESAEPLELGGTETFSANITDLSSLSRVWITIDGQTFNLTQSGAEVWIYSSWTPSTTGVFPYTIYAIDASGNLNTTSGSITVVDTTVPNLFNVVESADPLELGGTETFSVNITDLSSITGVWVTIDSQSFNLTLSGGEVWTTSAWTPTATGAYLYTIYAVDASNNINTTASTVTVSDTTPPNLFNIVESDNPLELGGTETFSVNITDMMTIAGVWVIVDSQSFNLTLSGGEVWTTSAWIPTVTGTYPYTIYAEDASGNFNTTAGFITVSDTTSPNLFNVVESDNPLELGVTETFSINITDLSSISGVWVTIDSQSFNLTLSGGEVWVTSAWTPTTTDTYFYTIYAEDAYGNINTIAGTITVSDTTIPNLFNVVESDNPLELGGTETFSVNITDLSSIASVWITIDSQSFNLTQSGIEVWINSSWTPSTTGTYSFTIYAVDASGNLNSISGSILIIDSYSPNIDYFTITPDVNSIQVGENFSLMVNASDISGINQVLVNFDENNYTLNENGENSWIINDLVINQIGNFNLTLLIQDNNDNWNSTIIGLSVEDNIFPTIVWLWENIDPNEFGDYTEILVNVTDNYLVKSVEITIDNEIYPLVQIHEEQWQLLWNNSKVGTFSYEILVIDGMNNTIVAYDSLTIRDTILPIITEYSLEKDLIGIQDNINISLITEDVSGIRNISIYIGGFLYFFTTSDNITFHFDDWSASNPGIFQFSIKITDNNGNVNTIVDTIEVKATNISNHNGMEGDENNLLNILTPSIIIVSSFAFIPTIVKQRKRKIGKGWEIPK